ncbi:MAG TPA: Ni/Fe hydrogenase subunit alpha [Solirubrobacteraceae bacterium]|nr:Ni/Fe hydrogenase subunit alpha [Solirubrobacteraceae bacterium]
MRERLLGGAALARVEGEGAVHVRLRDGRVEDVRLRIFEPPRFFEAFLRGRRFDEVPDITARICGICPVAYQMSACAAMEDACGVQVGDEIRRLRRLLYCGEWIESHVLHVFFLHAPDLLGYDSAFDMARDHRGLVERALALKKAGNALVRAIGGREIHPINVRVGGFHRAPRPAELADAARQLAGARAFAHEMVGWTASLPFPDVEEDFTFVALREPDAYAIEGGRMASSGGLDLAPREFDAHVVEEHVPHSTALHARLRDEGRYAVGPLARYALGGAGLGPGAARAARDAGLEPLVRNPFRSIVVRCAEVLHAVDEALQLIAAYAPPDPPAVDVVPRAGVGCGWTEAPRGLLWHRYEIDAQGTIRDARIVPPTSQNQARIEESVRRTVERHVALGDDELRDRCEHAVRSYDPCISCATHFLRLEVDRG